QILEDLNISFEHMPTGIDALSIVLREKELTPIKEQEILNYLTRKLEVDYVDNQHNLSTIVIVGENMKSQIGVTATATPALSREKINITMISQGSSEVSIMFVIDSKDEKR
ncbi:ACT domain-containing protein, partial [Streptococcus agalactiae]|uniref:ACT domain-containing protein n=1 Tax=Streptococcus agalactiae TaxID=1311 RepID=UPI003632269B